MRKEHMRSEPETCLLVGTTRTYGRVRKQWKHHLRVVCFQHWHHLHNHRADTFTFNCYFSNRPAILSSSCFLRVIIKRCISLTSHARGTSHFRELQKARLSPLSVIKVISRENEETIFQQKEKFSQWYIKALDLGKYCLSEKYEIVFETWRGSWEMGEDDVNNKLDVMSWTANFTAHGWRWVKRHKHILFMLAAPWLPCQWQPEPMLRQE